MLQQIKTVLEKIQPKYIYYNPLNYTSNIVDYLEQFPNIKHTKLEKVNNQVREVYDSIWSDSVRILPSKYGILFDNLYETQSAFKYNIITMEWDTNKALNSFPQPETGEYYISNYGTYDFLHKKPKFNEEKSSKLDAPIQQFLIYCFNHVKIICYNQFYVSFEIPEGFEIDCAKWNTSFGNIGRMLGRELSEEKLEYFRLQLLQVPPTKEVLWHNEKMLGITISSKDIKQELEKVKH